MSYQGIEETSMHIAKWKMSVWKGQMILFYLFLNFY